MDPSRRAGSAPSGCTGSALELVGRPARQVEVTNFPEVQQVEVTNPVTRPACQLSHVTVCQFRSVESREPLIRLLTAGRGALATHFEAKFDIFLNIKKWE